MSFSILANLFTLQVMLSLLAGVVIGMFIGILPGLGATMAISLMIPITFGMDPVPAIVLLASLYTTATYGGSFTSILLNTPGSSSNAATAQDGYELTKQGRGLEAIGMASVSSLFGGAFGGFMLLLISPQLARIALRFSSPEYFMIAILGLTLIGSLAGDDPLRGLISGAIGLVVGLVGLQATTAYARYTFGNIRLYDGIHLVPALLGLFTISQMLIQMERLGGSGSIAAGQVESAEVELNGRFFPPLKDLKAYLPLMCKASVLGMLIGILPGAGGDIGSWVGYNEAKRSVKGAEKEKFGKGSLFGICGSETANNAVCGGAYIPLLTLGIPGSGAAAVLLGGLTIHGIAPGYSLFTKQADIVYPIIWGYILANFLMIFFGVLIAKKVSKIASIPMNLIIPIVIVLALIGSYANDQSMLDVVITILFGFLGYGMKKTKFPTAPVVLAMILGPMAEESLGAALQMRKGMSTFSLFASRPLCWVFAILILLSLIAPFLSAARRKKNSQASASIED